MRQLILYQDLYDFFWSEHFKLRHQVEILIPLHHLGSLSHDDFNDNEVKEKNNMVNWTRKNNRTVGSACT